MRPHRHDREIVRLAIPALGALIAEPLYILADTAVVGHLGSDPLAGLAVASSILLIIYSLFIFLAYGTTASVARLIGAGDERQAAHQAVQGMWLAVLVGVVVVARSASSSRDRWSALLGATGEVRVQALIYLRISLFGVPAMLLVLAGTGYLRGPAGHPHTAVRRRRVRRVQPRVRVVADLRARTSASGRRRCRP